MREIYGGQEHIASNRANEWTSDILWARYHGPLPKEMRSVYRDMQLVFQDPYASLNPRMTVGHVIMEPMIVHRLYTPAERKKKVDELLEVVGLDSYHASRYPMNFQVGQRQRIGIARALVLNPKFIIADEPVSALDVSIQSQVLNLLKRLQLDYNIAYLFISHDLSVIKHISRHISVMYLGRIVESGDKEQIYQQTLHPYAKALLSAIPIADPKKKRTGLSCKVMSRAPPIHRQMYFHTRCSSCMEICRKECPDLKDVGEGIRWLVICTIER